MIISASYRRDGWYPEVLEAVEKWTLVTPFPNDAAPPTPEGFF